MMAEQLRFMQVSTPTVTGLVNATGYLLADGKKSYTVTLIDGEEMTTVNFTNREEAIDRADSYIFLLSERLASRYRAVGLQQQ